MTLKEIVTNSQYLTDETISDANLVAVANGCIAHINTEVGCALPFYTTANLTTEDYEAFSDSWQLRLLEPYICFGIFSNDTSLSDANFHLGRFELALKSFIKKGISTIVTEDDEGVETGYFGDAYQGYDIDITDRTVDGWF